ncbi:MAG: hypothetical protein WBD36_08435 [Bacteroidota bacterium]
MPALETFEWLVQQFWRNPDEETQRSLNERRKYLQSLRNESERFVFLEEFMEESREIKKQKKR